MPCHEQQSTAEKTKRCPRLLVHSWCIPGALLVHSWCTPGALVHSWCTPGALLVHSWCTPGALSVHFWCTLGALQRFPERELLRFRKEASILRTEMFGSPFRQLTNPKGNCTASERKPRSSAQKRLDRLFANLQTRKGIAPLPKGSLDPPHRKVWIILRQLANLFTEIFRLQLETRAVSTDTRVVSNDTRVVSTDTRAMFTDTRADCTDTRAVSSDTRAVPSDTRAVSPDTRAVLTRELCLPTRKLCPPTRGLCPPTPELCPPTRELCPPTRGLCPPTPELCPTTREMCPPTRDLAYRHESCQAGHVAIGNTTVVFTTCTRNWGNTSKIDLHLGNLHDVHNQDVGHIEKGLHQPEVLTEAPQGQSADHMVTAEDEVTDKWARVMKPLSTPPWSPPRGCTHSNTRA